MAKFSFKETDQEQRINSITTNIGATFLRHILDKKTRQGCLVFCIKKQGKALAKIMLSLLF